MSQEREKALAIQLDDGRVVVATPKPEDQESLAKLDKDIVFLTASGDYDTSGHGYGDLVELDVEGHAITLRLPSPADAEAVRRALAVGAVTATIVAAGAIAALQGGPQTQTVPEAAAPPAAIERTVPATQAEQDRDLGIMDLRAPAAPAVDTAPSGATQAEQDRDLGIMDLRAPAAPAVDTAPSGATQAEQDRDLGIMDLRAPAAPAVNTELDRALFQEDRMAERDPLSGSQPASTSGTDTAPASSGTENSGSHGAGRGELELP